MTAQPFWSFQRMAGAFLVLGFFAHAVGVLMFVSRRGGVAPGPGFMAVERSSIMTAVVLTAIGLMLLDGHLQDTAGGILTRMGGTTYLFAGAVLLTAEAFALSQGEKNVYALIVIYVVLAFLAQVAIGGALLQSILLPAWIGWLTIAWNLGWLVILPIITPGDMYYPVLHHLMPLLIGVPLLLGTSGAVTA